MRTSLLLLAAVAQVCLAESPIIIGVRGGVPFTDVIHIVQTGGSVSSSTDNYVVGPTFGIRLPLGLSVAADALFMHVSITQTPLTSSVSTSASASSWEFPVLARLTLGRGVLAPFVGAGVSVRHLSDFGNVGPFLTGSSGSQSVSSSTGVGFALSGGLQFKLGPLHVSPEIRYTHWGANQLSDAFSNFIRTNSNEAQFLVGLTF